MTYGTRTRLASVTNSRLPKTANVTVASRGIEPVSAACRAAALPLDELALNTISCGTCTVNFLIRQAQVPVPPVTQPVLNELGQRQVVPDGVSNTIPVMRPDQRADIRIVLRQIGNATNVHRDDLPLHQPPRTMRAMRNDRNVSRAAPFQGRPRRHTRRRGTIC